ncbi:MAG: hypothetical protein KAJ28_10690, partial [Flavobacteriaceae bacterium]|nr:hypothetical protein [Flavobacteriaceae bacterium]
MRIIYTLILVIVCFQARGQNQEPILTLSFEDTEIKEVLDQIENKTNIKFYYVEEWIKDKHITGNYNNVSITTILDDVFKETVINFYVLDNQSIILTQNNRIYDALPQGFFGETTQATIDSSQTVVKEVNEREINPIFYNEERASVPQSLKVEVVRIGKEDKNNLQQKFTLSGFVKNNKTGEPISNLAIIVKGKNIGTVTNNNGFYELKL